MMHNDVKYATNLHWLSVAFVLDKKTLDIALITKKEREEN